MQERLIKLTVSKGIEAKKVSITAADIIVKVASNGNVDDIVLNKKKADLTVSGDKTADITINSQAADTKITATAPVNIVAEKDTNVVLEEGSEGSTVDSSKDVKVDISGEAGNQATVKENGQPVAADGVSGYAVAPDVQG